MSKELVDYIKKSKEVGQSDEQIKQALIEAGWNEKDINSALNTKNKFSKMKLVFLIIAIFIGIYVLSAELFFKKHPNGSFYSEDPYFIEKIQEYFYEKKIENIREDISEKSENLLQEINKTNWKNFENDYFTFDYPENWTTEEEASDSVVTSLKLSGPKIKIMNLENKEVEIDSVIIGFNVYTPEKYIERHLLDKTKEQEAKQAMTDKNIKEFSRIFYSENKSYPLKKLFTLNNSDGFARIASFICTLTFLKTNNVIEIMFINIARDEKKFSLINLVAIDNKNNLTINHPYGKIIESIKIK